MQHTKHLLEIMSQLRDPDTGCPWDVEQNFSSIAPYTIEEAYEVADAIAKDDMKSLKEELGDLLLQVVFHAQMAEEKQLFNFEDIAEAICNKMINRHPHVFGDADIRTSRQQVDNWEHIKEQERKKNADDNSSGALDNIPLALPALTRAEKLGKRAAKTGFDWPEIAPVISKIEEELAELKEAVAKNSNENSSNHKAIYEEMGDLLFACTNLARHLKIDPEEALRRTNRKFETRFRYIEQVLSDQGKSLGNASLNEMEQLWNEAKSQERSNICNAQA